ncbi:MAG TPA: HesA/MoeB/ThiF family protein [Dehalococcoidales bacterium]|nr:HesA/MoeB/ThiF family protein [Dehalococcoidales bacterium]
MLTPLELTRYARQIIIPGLGEAGQEKLKKACVFLAGAGGLGSPAALYLAAAGIGKIRIADFDTVELSNLNRQVLHWTDDVGRLKVESAASKLRRLNPEVEIEAFNVHMSGENLEKLAAGSDVIVDAMDNLQTRYFLNQVAQILRIPFMHGAVSGLEGRAMTVLPGETACLMCLYRGADVKVKPPVLGATPALIASLQVTEVIKYLTGLGQLLAGRFLIYDGLNMRFAEIQVSRDPHCPHCGSQG